MTLDGGPPRADCDDAAMLREWDAFLFGRVGASRPRLKRLETMVRSIRRDAARRLIDRLPARHGILRNELEDWARREWGA